MLEGLAIRALHVVFWAFLVSLGFSVLLVAFRIIGSYWKTEDATKLNPYESEGDLYDAVHKDDVKMGEL